MEKNPAENKSRSEEPATVYRYVGNGDFLQGVPARDLTKDDFDALTDEQKDAVKNAGTYKKGGSR